MSYSDLRKKHGINTSTNKTESKPVGKTVSQSGGGGGYAALLKKHGISYDVDDNFINTFLSDANRFLSSAQDDYDKVGWSNASSSYDSRHKSWEELDSRYTTIRGWLYTNKSKLDEGTYKSLSDTLDSYKTSASSVLSRFKDAKDNYSQWETEDDYKAAMAQKQDYEEKLAFDLDVGAKEIEHLTRVADEFATVSNQYFQVENNPDRFTQEERDNITAKYQALVNKYGTPEDLLASLNEKKVYLTNAKRLQEGVKLASVSGNEDFTDYSGYISTKDDGFWSKLTSQYGMGYEDLTYEYINGVENGMRSEIVNKAIAFNADNSIDATEKFTIYDNMTEDEIAIYNYYYAKDGKEAAQKYLDSIQESLNYREATGMFANMEDKALLELAFGVAAGLDQFESGVKNLFNTKDDYIPQSATQMASGMVREDLADVGPNLPKWLGGASLGQMGYDTITTTANMAPSILTSMAIGAINPVAGQVVGTGLMGMSAAGNAYQEALNLGYDKSQARAYSTLVGASEAGLQYLIGGVGKLGGKLTGGAVTKMLSGVDNAIFRTAGKIVGNMISEGMEEGLQEILTPWFKNLTLHMDEDVNWSEVAYSSLLGALTAGFMEGTGTISGEMSTYKTGKNLQAADISVERLAEIGKTFSADTVAYQLAGRVDENAGAYTMGRLFNEIGATLSEQNVTEITEALVVKGMDETTAKKNAEALAYVVEGGQLSERQIAVIEANEVLAEVARTTLIDANTTWNQRSIGYNEMLKALADEMTSPKASRTKQAQQGVEKAPVADTVGGKTENGTESLSEAESVDTSPAKVRSISSIENGQVTIKLEDDTEVSVKDADLSPDDGVRIETIASIDGISAEDATFILNTLRTNTNASTQMDSLGAKEAYKYGFYGFSQEHMTTHGVFSNSLTESQRKSIYETGRNARQKQVEAKQATVSKATGKKSLQAGKVHFEGDHSSLTERQSASLTAMEKVADALGVQIYVFESELNERGKRVGANGWYDPKDGSIHIDLHAGANGEGTMLFTAAHELTHFIRQWSPAKFKTLADFLMQEYGKKGVNTDALVREQMAKAKRNGRTISYDTAYEEVVADSMEMMLSDGKVMEKLAKLKAKDESLWQKIKDFINELATKIRSAYEGMSPDSVEGRHVAEMVDAIERLQNLFTEGLVEASENYQLSEQVLAESGIAVDAETDSGSLFSVRDVLDAADRNKVAKALAERFNVTVKEAMEWLTAETSLASLILNPKYSRFLDYEADPGETAIKQNSDYPQGTVDFSNICKKRREFTQVMNRVLRNFPNHVFAATDLAKIRTIMGEEGMTLPCGICYVEDRRQLDTIVAQDFIDGLKLYREGSKTRPDGKPFNANQLKGLQLTDGDTYVPTIYELVSLEGRNSLKAKNPNMEAAWVKYNNARGMQSVRLLTNEAEYKRQILKYSKSTVQSKNDKGGLRIYSFSDAEMFHLIDIIQVITDSAAVGLSLQGYTKVNEYAKAVKDTGEKLNRSLIPKGDLGYHMEDGKVVLDYDTVEGIDIYSEDFFDNKDNPNVGNITIGVNDIQIRAAMVSDFVDQIIPFHTGQSEDVLGEKGIAAWKNYKDFQTEKDIATGKTSNHQVNIYTEVIQAAENEGKPIQNKRQFVEKFLEVCKENGLQPRFSDFLNTDAQGNYIYTEGYHKFLVDFKTFAQTEVGEYLPQMPVKPIFDNAYITGLLKAYVKEQQVKDAEVAEQMPRVIERITDEIIKPDSESVETDQKVARIRFSDRETLEQAADVLAKIGDEEYLKSKEEHPFVIVMDHTPEVVLKSMDGEGKAANRRVIIRRDALYLAIREDGVQEGHYHGLGEEVLKKLPEYLEQPDVILKTDGSDKKRIVLTSIPVKSGQGIISVEFESIKDIGGEYEYFNVIVTVFDLHKNYLKGLFKKHNAEIKYEKEDLVQVNPQLYEWLRIFNTKSSENNVTQPELEVKKFSDRDRVPTFYSHMARVVDGVKQEKLGAASVVNMLRGKGVKAEEIKWSGIETWLEGKKSVTKAELQEFIAGSMLQIEEEHSGRATFVGEDGTTYESETSFKDAAYAIAAEQGIDRSRVKFVIDTDDMFAYAYVGSPTNQILEADISETEGSSPRWGQYKLDGGENYREIIFKMPGSEYSNRAMRVHWGETTGVLAHARIQDFNTFLGKMLFIEEIQSDWHNEGHASGYESAEYKEAERASDELFETWNKIRHAMNKYARSSEFLSDPEDVRKKKWDWFRRKEEVAYKKRQEADARLESLLKEGKGIIPDAPFRDTYHEYVLKRLIRMAAEQDYDSIGWTTADIQSKRWSEEFAEGYRIEYDQDIPKFLSKYGKRWGTKVGKTVLDSGAEVWSMAITDSMKDSVLTDGQPLYSDRDSEGNQLSAEQQEFFKDSKVRDANGNLMVMYHGTANGGAFTVFDGDKLGNDTRTTQIGQGFYFTNMKNEAESYTKNVDIYGKVSRGRNPHLHQVYLNITNPFDITADMLDVEKAKAVYMDGTYDYFFNSWIPFYLDKKTVNGRMLTKAEIQAMNKSEKVSAYVEYLSRFGTKELLSNMVRAFPYGKQSELLASMKKQLGYDGLVEEFKPGQYQYVAFSSEQVKDIDNNNPTTNPDIRYQDRAEDSVSNRSLLANALEGVAQNEIERNKIQEYKGKISLINSEEQKLHELNEQIKELSFAKGPRNTKKIRDLQIEAKQTANRISTYDKQLLRLEASKPLQDVLAREKKMAYQRAEQKGKEALAAYKEKTAKTQRELLDKWKESRKKGIESREKTAMRHKIQSVVGELNQLLLSNDKKRHVPENLKKAVADALALVNMDTVGAEERAAKYAALIAKETDPDKIDAYTMTMENILRQGEKMGQRLKELRDAYEEIQNSDDPDIANAYDPVIAGSLQEIAQSIGNTSLRNMTIDQLQDVYDMYKMVLTRVRDANKSLIDSIKETIANRASRVVGEVKRVGGEHKYRVAILDFVKKFGWDNLKPVYAFEHIGSATLTDAFNQVRAGEDTWAVDVSEAREYYLDKSKKYGYDSWDIKKKYRFRSTSETEFELTLEQILSLYAYSKREQAHDHLRLGGFVFDSNIETYKEKEGKSGKSILKYKVNTADAHQISPEILANITGTLTKEQMAFVDEMQEYLSTVMGAKGNEITMKMYGVKLFKEKFYFPLKSAKQFMFEQNEVSGEVRLKNSGFTNKVVAKANNPVILSNFMDVWANHVNDMSMYHSFVLPLEDFNRIFNYNSPKQEGRPPVSVKGTIQNAYSPAVVGYVRQLITDLNGGARSDSTTGIINKMIGLFKKGSVFASLSVVVQQPSAIARAAALVDTKYFIGPKVDHKRHKALWDEVKQYAPVAIIKEMGYFDTNMGKSTQDFILGKEYSGFSEKMKALVTDSGYRDEVLSKAPALADEIAWCGIWEAVKRETKAKNPGMDVKSEVFLKKAGERFTEVITKTQVYDSVLSRSGLMRSKDTGMKMATAFMAEPTTSINIVVDALLQGKRGNRKYARSAIGAVIASQILNSILVSFVYAGRDDDEDETYLEKYIGTLSGEILDSLNPAGYIPFIKDIMSIVQGYDVERSDMAVVSDLWNAIQNLSKDNVPVYRKVEGFAGSIAQIFGLPVKNIMRDARGIYQTIDSFVNGQQTTKAGIGYAVKGAITGKTVSNDQQLYEAILSGDQTQVARVKSRFDDASAVNSAIRKALRENDPRIHEAAVAWNGNDLDVYMRIAKQIIAEKYFSQDDVVMAIRAEANALDPDTGTTSTSKAKGLFTAEKFAEAIAQGDEATANAIKIDIIQTGQKNGKTEDEAEESFVSSAKSELKELFLSGEISEDKVVDALVAYCDMDESEAELKVESYAWEEQGYEGATSAAVRDYNTFCAASNVPKDVYLHIRSFANNTENDKDANGKSIAYSAMKKIMAEINAQSGLTSAQKTAIARSLGWAEKNVQKYKTW